MVYVKVSIPILLFKTFIYSYNKSAKNIFIGQGVTVEFNNRNVSGFITDISKSTKHYSNLSGKLEITEASLK